MKLLNAILVFIAAVPSMVAASPIPADKLPLLQRHEVTVMEKYSPKMQAKLREVVAPIYSNQEAHPKVKRQGLTEYAPLTQSEAIQIATLMAAGMPQEEAIALVLARRTGNGGTSGTGGGNGGSTGEGDAGNTGDDGGNTAGEDGGNTGGDDGTTSTP